MSLAKFKDSFFKDNCLSGQIILACSGGPDSTCLLHILKQAAQNTDFEDALVCAHFDHRWNSASGKATEVLKKLCHDLQIRFVSGTAKEAGRNSEAEARAERYDFLYTIAKEFDAKAILTAHHLDDQIETFFLRLLRGSGSEGLACIQPRRLFRDDIFLLRPLLNLSKDDLLQYCLEYQLDYYEDPTNTEQEIKRNQIRIQLLPILEEIQPACKGQILNLIEILKAENDFIQKSLLELPGEAFHSCRAFAKQPLAMQRQILKSLLEKHNLAPSYELIERLRKGIVAKEKMKISIGRGYFLKSNSVRFKLVHELSTSKAQRVPFETVSFSLGEAEIHIPQIGQFVISEKVIAEAELQKERNAYRVYVDLSNFAGQKLELRSRQPKDRFQPVNSNYSTKLKSFLINRKVKLEASKYELNRENLLVLALENSSEVLWIPGVELGDQIKIRSGGFSTHCLQFTPSKILA